MKEESVLNWLIHQKKFEEIPEITDEMKDKLIETEEHLAVIFCKFLTVSNDNKSHPNFSQMTKRTNKTSESSMNWKISTMSWTKRVSSLYAWMTKMKRRNMVWIRYQLWSISRTTSPQSTKGIWWTKKKFLNGKVYFNVVCSRLSILPMEHGYQELSKSVFLGS